MELNEVIKSRRKVLAISLSTVNKLLGVLGLEMDFKIRKTIL